LIRGAGARPAGVLLALDRQERGAGDLSAVQEVRAQYSIPVIAVITLADLMHYITVQGRPEELASMQAYRDRYGLAD
jgi:orotate phosphoribosyltransferase